ncbi:hypothetical protein PT126_05300 [Erysipelothrix rhusiopathiae]|nr:hypothetical protein [Erysipelothrix rhusiopathiae]
MNFDRIVEIKEKCKDYRIVKIFAFVVLIAFVAFVFFGIIGTIGVIGIAMLYILAQSFLFVLANKDEEEIIYDALVFLNDEDTSRDLRTQTLACEYANKSIDLSKKNKHGNTFIMFIAVLCGSAILVSTIRSKNPINLVSLVETLIIPVAASIWVLMTSFNKIRVEFLKLLLKYDLEQVDSEKKATVRIIEKENVNLESK